MEAMQFRIYGAYFRFLRKEVYCNKYRISAYGRWVIFYKQVSDIKDSRWINKNRDIYNFDTENVESWVLEATYNDGCL